MVNAILELTTEQMADLTPEELEVIRQARLLAYLQLDAEEKAIKTRKDGLKEVIKLDIIDGAKYENETHYLLLTDPIVTTYDGAAIHKKFGLDFLLEVSKVQNGTMDERVKEGKVKREDLAGTFSTHPGSPALKIYKQKG